MSIVVTAFVIQLSIAIVAFVLREEVSRLQHIAHTNCFFESRFLYIWSSKGHIMFSCTAPRKINRFESIYKKNRTE